MSAHYTPPPQLKSWVRYNRIPLNILTPSRLKQDPLFVMAH
uniref:Uncharacterized protein n=1 Tax=Anguilla anguilla TaxID=7936 RepID=A0A0E9REX7_ANGAN